MVGTVAAFKGAGGLRVSSDGKRVVSVADWLGFPGSRQLRHALRQATRQTPRGRMICPAVRALGPSKTFIEEAS